MKKNKILIIFISVLIILTSCAPVENEETPMVEETEDTVIDSVERLVEIPEEIDSIAALYTVVGHVIIMLEEGDKITASSNGLKRDKLILNMEPHIEDIYLPKSGGIVNIEELLNSEPDMIFVDIPIYWNKDELDKIEKLGVPYYVLEFNSMEEQKDLVRDVGKILNRKEEADEYIDLYDEIIELTQRTVENIPEEERVRVYHSINEAVRTSAEGTITNQWLEMAGLVNVAQEGDLRQDEDKYFTSLEDILKWNPEVILTNEPATYDYIKEQDNFQSLDAVLNDKVYLLPTGISRWGHSTSLETPLAMLWVLKNIYPEYSEDVDLIGYTRRFYSELFNYDLTDEEIDNILAGVDMRKAKDLED
jgi:iron complex transport system substrate-binding protein